MVIFSQNATSTLKKKGETEQLIIILSDVTFKINGLSGPTLLLTLQLYISCLFLFPFFQVVGSSLS